LILTAAYLIAQVTVTRPLRTSSSQFFRWISFFWQHTLWVFSFGGNLECVSLQIPAVRSFVFWEPAWFFQKKFLRNVRRLQRRWIFHTSWNF